MGAAGYIQVHAFTSNARLPLKDVTILITDQDGKNIAMRQTDRSGIISPVAISTPELSASLEPGADVPPFTTINLYARLSQYEQVEAKNIQVFPDTITNQELEMIPLAEFPEFWTQSEIFQTQPQNL